MGFKKNYLLTILEQCSEEKFGQDAVEAALVNGTLTLTYNLPTDLHTIFDLRSNCCDAPPQGECCAKGSGRCSQCGEGAQFESNYDKAVVAYQKQCREHGDALVEVYRASGIMEEILRPMSLAQHIPQPVQDYAGTHHSS